MNFEYAAQRERTFLEAWYKRAGITTFSHTDLGGYDRWDSTFTTPTGERWLGEAKVRENRLDQYPDYLIEKDKYLAVMSKAQEQQAHPFYFNAFSDGWALFFQLEKWDPFWVQRECPRTTCGNRSTKWKWVGFLPKSVAVKPVKVV